MKEFKKTGLEYDKIIIARASSVLCSGERSIASMEIGVRAAAKYHIKYHPKSKFPVFEVRCGIPLAHIIMHNHKGISASIGKR